MLLNINIIEYFNLSHNVVGELKLLNLQSGFYVINIIVDQAVCYYD